jgi:hypothetical protein
MPKRVVDGEAIYTSRKLKLVDPEWMRGEYANLLPLALANGVFEYDIDQIWARVYAYLRPSISRDDVVALFAAYERTGLIFWWEDENGKRWGFWVGIDKPGRLPSLKRQKGRHERVGPEPPREKLEQYLRDVNQRSAIGRPLVSLGFGFGLGSGSGSGEGSRASHAPAAEPPAPGVCEQIVSRWNTERGSFPEILKLTEGRRRKIQARIRADAEFPDKLLAAVTKARQTPFLCGSGERGWKADFDWFIANDTNYVAILEGKYDGGKGGSNGKQSASDLAIQNARALGLTERPVN